MRYLYQIVGEGVNPKAVVLGIASTAGIGKSGKEADALDLIGRLKSQRLLDGFRGAAALDRTRLADLLVRLGDLGVRFPRIREVDINPLIVVDGRPKAVDAAVVL